MTGTIAKEAGTSSIPSNSDAEASPPAHYFCDEQSFDNYELESNQSFHSHYSMSSGIANPPIVVGYAFGPKKMSTMGVVLAEASRIQVIHEEIEEDGFDKDEEDLRERERDEYFGEQQEDPSALTSAALKGLEAETTGRTLGDGDHPGQAAQETIITLGNSNDTNMQHIVRYFRSSCSSAASASIASMGETTASTSTPTTATTTTNNTSSTFCTYKQRRHSSLGERNRFPVQIAFVPLDPDQPLEDQHGGKFDLILHKLTEDILTCSLMEDSEDSSDRGDSNEIEAGEQASEDPSQKRVRAIRDYCYLRNPNCCLVDDPKRVQLVMSRSQIARVLKNCLNGVKTSSGIPVKSPRFVVVPGSAPHRDRTRELKHALQNNNEGDDTTLSTPLIVKPLIAAGTKQSHCMFIALKDSALTRLPPKSIVQEFVNHDATLYKVYVLGDFVNVYRRHSLPNLPADLSEATVDLVEFDSQRPYPILKDFGLETEKSDDVNARGSCAQFPVTVEEVRPIVEALKRAFGLELFGFDILMGSNSGQCFVVDVNYFPSYKEVPNFPSLLARYLTQRALEQRRKGRMQMNASSSARHNRDADRNCGSSVARTTHGSESTPCSIDGCSVTDNNSSTERDLFLSRQEIKE